MDRDYLQEALAKFNTDKAQWYGFRKTDDNGDTIPNDQRMKYEHLILNDDTATMSLLQASSRIRFFFYYTKGWSPVASLQW